MLKQVYLVLIAALACGCATTEKAYRPRSSAEKDAIARADRALSPAAVRADFRGTEHTEVAWAGVIKDVQFAEKERSIQVAFQVEHRAFDWMDHGGGKPYRLSAESEGEFVAGWTVPKPARIDFLRAQAQPGYMLIVYGKPYRMREGVVQLAATAVRPIKKGDFEIVEVADASDEIDAN